MESSVQLGAHVLCKSFQAYELERSDELSPRGRRAGGKRTWAKSAASPDGGKGEGDGPAASVAAAVVEMSSPAMVIREAVGRVVEVGLRKPS